MRQTWTIGRHCISLHARVASRLSRRYSNGEQTFMRGTTKAGHHCKRPYGEENGRSLDYCQSIARTRCRAFEKSDRCTGPDYYAFLVTSLYTLRLRCLAGRRRGNIEGHVWLSSIAMYRSHYHCSWPSL